MTHLVPPASFYSQQWLDDGPCPTEPYIDSGPSVELLQYPLSSFTYPIRYALCMCSTVEFANRGVVL